MRQQLCISVTCLWVVTASAPAQTTYRWAEPLDGLFREPSNWLPVGVPGPLDTAVVGGSTPYVVTLDASTNVATLDLANAGATAALTAGHTLELGLLTGPGELVVNSDGLPAPTRLRVGDDSVIAASVVLNAPVDSITLTAARIQGTGVGRATIAPGGVITGRGVISGRLTNHGRILAEGADASIAFAGATVSNGPAGAVVVRDGGRIELAAGSHVTGGRWIGSDGGDPAVVASDTWQNVIADAVFEGVWGMPGGTNLTLGGDCTGPGVIEVRVTPTTDSTSLFLGPDAVLGLPVVFHGGWLNQDHTFFSTIGADAVLTGSTLIQGDHYVQGVLSPGKGPEGIGAFLTTNGNLKLLEGAGLHLDISGPERAQYDHLRSGRYSLGGTLSINFTEGYVPSPSDRYGIIQSYIDGGRFARVEIEDVLPEVGPPHLVYAQRQVSLILCAADRDGDGQLTIFDHLVYQNQFHAGDLGADLDGDGELTVLDFMAFQNRFDAGCG